jgi:protein-tyrosine phosphatase
MVKVKKYPADERDLEEWRGLLYYPAQKITKHVWIGSEKNAADPNFIKKHNIKLVVNCTADIPRYSQIPMLRVPVQDAAFDASKMAKYLSISSLAIRDVTRYGGNVLVHCRAGQNRSSSVVAAYLMTIKGITSTEAMRIIRSKKPETFRPMNFLPALKDYEKNLITQGVIKKKTKPINKTQATKPKTVKPLKKVIKKIK